MNTNNQQLSIIDIFGNILGNYVYDQATAKDDILRSLIVLTLSQNKDLEEIKERLEELKQLIQAQSKD